MAELVDALDSKSGEHLLVPVQVRPAVPEIASDGKTAPLVLWLGRVFSVDLPILVTKMYSATILRIVARILHYAYFS